jgi:hypothetical protein
MASDLLNMQAPAGVPRSDFFETVSDPLLPPQRVDEMLAHFHEAVYDMRPESHISRLMKVLLGQSGTGQLRKRYTYAHLSQFVATTRFHDLDRFFSGIFGLKRFIRERLDIDAYTAAATDAEWEAINVADASYRSRLEAFTASLSMAGTPSGLAMAASALLGVEVRIYETYEFLEMGGALPFDSQVPLAGARSEFIVRPLREITSEEEYQLVRVLDRLKPADALMTIDSSFAAVFTHLTPARVSCDSSYWHVRKQVSIEPQNARYYPVYVEGTPVEQPRLAFTQYQGEAWNYNADATSVSSYAEDEDGVLMQDVNFNRFVDDNGQGYDYTPNLAIKDPTAILLGRYVSDGILSSPIADRSEG